MNTDKYERTMDELKEYACMWWPKEVRDEADSVSVLQILLDTQEKFISLLNLADKAKPENLFSLIEAADFPYPLFLKHLMVLVDFGGEPLQRMNKEFDELFEGKVFVYNIGEGEYGNYHFSVLPVRGKLSNKRMKVDSVEHLVNQKADKSLCKDLIMILVYGAAAVSAKTRAVLFKCAAYEYLGNETLIESFVRQNYIRVSRIIGGKTATDLGNSAQQYAIKYLSRELGENYCVKGQASIPGISQNDGKTLIKFDIVIDRIDDTRRHKKYVAIEVMFQETTNSTMERKCGQAADRFDQITRSRNYIAYILDGAGLFDRKSALETLCDNSHCTVAYTPEEFAVLTQFIKECLDG